jgi:hypothetical protein
MPIVPGAWIPQLIVVAAVVVRGAEFSSFAELLAKKRKRDEQWAAEKAASAVEAKKKARTTRSAIFKRAEQYVTEYRSQVPEGGWIHAQHLQHGGWGDLSYGDIL